MQPRRMQKPLQKRTLKTRARLLGASAEVDARNGYEALRVEEVVQAAGVALLESLAVGLPSVVAGHCLHAGHVKAGRAGILLSSPFSREEFQRAVLRYMDGIFRADCRESGRLYARLTDLGSMYREGADLIERLLEPGS